MKNVLKIASVALFGFASTAMAATVTETIDLTGRGGAASAYAFSGLGVSVNVTGVGHTAGVIDDPRNVFLARTGLGVHKIGGRENHQLDGKGVKEMMLFAFDRSVSITNVTFSFFSSNDNFELATYAPGQSNPVLTSFLNDLAIDPLSSGDGLFNDGKDDFGTASLQTGTSSIFGIGADDLLTAFRVNSITVSYDDGVLSRVSQVPLPAGGVLLIAGLGGLAALRRRRRA